jgi:DNA-binding transcriptional regulator YhcF (GntR family)
MEYNRTTGDFFMSDKALAELFGVSDKTISRAFTALEDKGFITRTTKNVKAGKERHVSVNIEAIDKALPTDNLSVVQQTICPLSNGQNDFIKEKEKENIIKENTSLSRPKDKVEVVSEILKNSTSSEGGFKF